VDPPGEPGPYLRAVLHAKEGSGTGLGISITYGSCRSSGRVTVESASQGQPVSRCCCRSERGLTDGALRVLFVDDEEELGRRGRAVRLRGIEAAARRTASRLSPGSRRRTSTSSARLRMPGLGGLDVIKRLKQSPPTRSHPPLGSRRRRTSRWGSRLGAFDYLQKPVRDRRPHRDLPPRCGQARS